MQICALVVGLGLMAAHVTIVELPDVGDLPKSLEQISIASGDWRGKHVDDLIAACGDPSRTIDLRDGGHKLVYRFPLHQGWTLTADSPTLEDLSRQIESIQESERSSATERHVVIGKLSLVFETSPNDRVIGVAVEQKLRKRYRGALPAGAD